MTLCNTCGSEIKEGSQFLSTNTAEAVHVSLLECLQDNDELRDRWLKLGQQGNKEQ
jgi:hypothetical protein